MTFDEDALRAALRDAPSPTPRSDLAQAAIARGQRIRLHRRVGAIAGACAAALALGAVAVHGSVGVGTSAVPTQTRSDNPIYAPSLGGGTPTPGVSAPGVVTSTESAQAPAQPVPGTPAPGEATPGSVAGSSSTTDAPPADQPSASGGPTSSSGTTSSASSASATAKAGTASGSTSAASSSRSPAAASPTSDATTQVPTPSASTKPTPTSQPITLTRHTFNDGASCLVPKQWDGAPDETGVIRLDRGDKLAWVTCGTREQATDDAASTFENRTSAALSEGQTIEIDVRDEEAGTQLLVGTKIDHTQPGAPEVLVYQYALLTPSWSTSTRWQFPVAERDAVMATLAKAKDGLKPPTNTSQYPPLTFPGKSPSGTALDLKTRTTKATSDSGVTYEADCDLPAAWIIEGNYDDVWSAVKPDESAHVSCVLTPSDPEAELARRLTGLTSNGYTLEGLSRDDKSQSMSALACRDNYCEYTTFRWTTGAIVEQGWEFLSADRDELAATIAEIDANLTKPTKA